nr:hypothetical protein CFP56_09057 [Quercus suber]
MLCLSLSCSRGLEKRCENIIFSALPDVVGNEHKTVRFGMMIMQYEHTCVENLLLLSPDLWRPTCFSQRYMHVAHDPRSPFAAPEDRIGMRACAAAIPQSRITSWFTLEYCDGSSPRPIMAHEHNVYHAQSPTSFATCHAMRVVEIMRAEGVFLVKRKAERFLALNWPLIRQCVAAIWPHADEIVGRSWTWVQGLYEAINRYYSTIVSSTMRIQMPVPGNDVERTADLWRYVRILVIEMVTLVVTFDEDEICHFLASHDSGGWKNWKASNEGRAHTTISKSHDRKSLRDCLRPEPVGIHQDVMGSKMLRAGA